MTMMIFLLSLMLAAAVVVNGQTSQPECRNLTQTQLYEPNPKLQPAEDKYNEMVAGVLDSNCIDAEGGLKPCDIGLGQSEHGDNYTEECAGGNMWTYDFAPKCDNSVEQMIRGVLVCASKDCVGVGVQNLIPHDGLFAPFEARNISCGSGTNNLKMASTSGTTSSYTSAWMMSAAAVVSTMVAMAGM